MAISSIAVSSTDTVNTVTVTDSSGITVTTVGEQGLSGPNTILGRNAAAVTAGSSDAGTLLVYDHGNTNWTTTDRYSSTISVGGLTVASGGVTSTPTLRVATVQYTDGDAAFIIADGGGVNIPTLTTTTVTLSGKLTADNNEIEGGNFDINGGDIASSVTIHKSPVITLAGDLSGTATLTNLGNATLTATVTADATALGTDTTGAYVATIVAGEGIDISGSGAETANVTVSAEDASDANKGVASFSATDFSVSSGAVTLQAERIQDLVGAMVSSNTETGITVSYQDGDGTIDFVIADATDSVKGISSFNSTDFTVSSGAVTLNAERVSDIVGAMVSSNTESGISVTYQDGDNTLDFDVGDFDIALTGDVVGSGTVTNLANVSFSATIQANSVALSTDTTGDYVGTITGGTGVDSTAATSGEGTTHTLSLDLNELTTETTIADADFIAMVDATDNGSGKITFENLEDAIFASVSGDITIAENGAATIANNAVALGTDTTGNYMIDVAVGEGLDVSHSQGEGSTATLSAELATETNAGVATFDGTDFTVSSGDVTVKVERVQDIVGAMVGSNTESGIAVTYEDGDGTLDFNVADPTITIDGDVDGSATMTNLGNTTITTTLDTVNSNVGSYGTATAIPALTVNAKGLVTAISTNAISTSFTLAADSGSNDTFNTGETLTISGTSNEVETAVSNNAITIGLPDNVTIGGNLVVSGNYTVNGTTTTVSTATLEVEDPLIKLARANNAADSVDIGLYGLYDTSGSQDLYAGLFRDASDSGKWKLFKSLQAEPTTTVNVSGTGYAKAILVADIEGNVTGNVTGALTGNAATATALATARTIGGTSFDGTANIAVALSATATALASARTIHGVSFDGTANIDLSEVVADTVGAMFSSNTETGITATYQDGDNTIDLVIGTLNQNTTGLAATATALATGRTIALSGDVAASGVSFDGTGNITLSTTIQANSVALGTDTTGNYIATIADAGNTHITVANSGAESAAVTLNITDNAVGIAQLAGIARGKIIYGDASGNPALLAIGSNGEVLKSDGTDIAWSADAGLTTEAVQDIVGAMFSSNTETGITVTYEDGDGTVDLVVATLNQDTTGLAGTATALATGRTIGMTGDVVWTSASFDGSGNVTGSATIQANSVALGTDTTGNYVDNVTGGTGVSVTGSAGEGWEPAIAIGQAVGTSDGVTFGSVSVDNFTLNGTELDLSSGDFTLDVAGDIILDADGGDIFLHDGGTQFGKLSKATNNITQFNTVDAIIMPLGTTGQRPTGAAGMFRYNSTDGKFEGYTNAWGEIGGGGSGLFTTNEFTGDGTETDFTLSTAPSSEDMVMAFIDGVYQNKNAYTLSSTTIAFDTAPVNQKKVIVHVVGSTVSGSNANLDSFSGNGSTTAFTLNLDPITENNTQVYIDGVYQMKSGYSVSGTTLTFSAAPPDGTSIEVATFTQNTLNAPANDSVTGAKIADNAVDSEHYVDGSIDLAHMSANSVDSAQYVDGSIDLAHMSVNSIDSDQYVDGSIDLVHMSANSVDSDQYVDGSIDLVHMSANSIDSDQYVDGSIDNAHLADDAVGVAELSATGTASSSTFLRGDNSWTAVSTPITALNNATANELVTVGSTTTELDAEANLVFDGTNLLVGLSSSIANASLDNLQIGGGSGNVGMTIYSGTSNYGGIAFADGNTGSSDQYPGLIEFYHNDNSMRLYTAATERMRIDSSGRVHIGVTSGAVNLLHVEATDNSAAKFRRSTASATTGLGDPAICEYSTGGNMADGFGSVLGFAIRDSAGASNNIGFLGATRAGADNTGDLIFHTYASGSQSEKMRIDSSGNVTKPSSSCFGGARNGGHVTDDQVFIGDTAHTNVGSDYATGNGRYTAPVDGNYLIYADLTSTDSGSSATQNWWSIRKNGTDLRKFLSHKTGAYHHKITGTAIVTLAANDYIEWYVGESGTTGGWVGSQHIFNNMGAVLLG